MLRTTAGLCVSLFFLFACGLGCSVLCLGEEASPPDTQLLQMVLELLREEDKDIRGLALEQIRNELKGEAVTRRLAEELPKLKSEAQVGLLGALVDRGDKAARPAIVSLLKETPDSAVRQAAMRALAFLGEPADAQLLLPFFLEGTDAERQAAQFALTRIPGAEVGAAIIQAAERASAEQFRRLIALLLERRESAATARLLEWAGSGDPARRAAAVAALGDLAGPEQLPQMVRLVLATPPGRDREAVEKAVMLVCARIPDPEQRDASLLAAMKSLNETERVTLLPTLGRVGGKSALAMIEAAIQSQDAARHEAGIRAIANWPDGSVAERLIELAQHDPHPAHRITCLRALIRVAPLATDRSDEEKLSLLKTAMSLCTRDEERLLVLQRAQAIRHVATLRYLMTFLDQPAYAEAACLSIVELAHHRDLREPNKAEFDKALDAVIRTSKDAVVVERANRYKKGQTWVRPKGSQ
ncbi:MAG: HEAT repeat domain-containing protein [Thermogutta sp.]|nr:HEAT repeat domain-containing protein [Thermogutta sp.]HOP78778.1 HEAT repeat domain-containing protein [Thermogutta sp.]HPU07771.1 HEAT repeat domain-containing protein [Thermogutta sp.]HQF14323.1 HEAT repeat domain-containing protein [Thermogutta sp.]